MSATQLPKVAALGGKYYVRFNYIPKVTILEDTEKLVSPAKVIFDCLSTENLIEIPCKAGLLRYPNCCTSTSTVWNIPSLGTIQVPEQIQWSEEEIKEAFMELAKQLLSQPEILGTQIWTVKEVAQISLE